MPGYWFFNHPGCAYRREDILAVNGYGKTPPQFAEDYALWIKFLKAGYTMYNLPDVLIRYRLWNRQKSANCRTPEWYDFLETQKQKLND